MPIRAGILGLLHLSSVFAAGRLRQAPADLLTAPQREELLELCRKARERYQ